jgi:hypothetical protein
VKKRHPIDAADLHGTSGRSVDEPDMLMRDLVRVHAQIGEVSTPPTICLFDML